MIPQGGATPWGIDFCMGFVDLISFPSTFIIAHFTVAVKQEMKTCGNGSLLGRFCAKKAPDEPGAARHA